MLSDRLGDHSHRDHGSPNLCYHPYPVFSDKMKRVPLIVWMTILLTILGVFFYVIHQQTIA